MSHDDKVERENCKRCYGRGHVTPGSYNLPRKACPDCGGSGYESPPSAERDTVPPGYKPIADYIAEQEAIPKRKAALDAARSSERAPNFNPVTWTRKIRACEGEVAAQLALEQAIAASSATRPTYCPIDATCLPDEGRCTCVIRKTDRGAEK